MNGRPLWPIARRVTDSRWLPIREGRRPVRVQTGACGKARERQDGSVCKKGRRQKKLASRELSQSVEVRARGGAQSAQLSRLVCEASGNKHETLNHNSGRVKEGNGDGDGGG